MPRAPRDSRSKYYVFTENNEPEALIEALNAEWPLPGLAFVYGQLEVAPETGHLHFQGFLGTTERVRTSQLKKLLSPTAHFEKMRGSVQDSLDYCSKQSSALAGPFQWGEIPSCTQGRRSDLLLVQQAIGEGATYEQLADEYFVSWTKYRGAFQEYIGMKCQEKSLRGKKPCHVEVHWGVPGSGKSTMVSTKYPDAYHYSYNKGNWWPGYKGQDVVIIEEMQGFYFQYSFLCLLLDTHPLQVEIKGGFVPMCATKFIFTSNTDPKDWYSAKKVNTSALDRRISEIYYYPFKYPYGPGNEPFQTRFLPSPDNSEDESEELMSQIPPEKVPEEISVHEIYAMSCH